MLTARTLPAAARDAVIDRRAGDRVVADPPTPQWRTDRARMAVYLIASSYHYQVQR